VIVFVSEHILIKVSLIQIQTMRVFKGENYTQQQFEKYSSI